MKQDGLNRTVYAAKIADEISEHYNAQKRGEESDGIVFAISGKWGEGKTELLNFLEPNLKDKGFTVVRFNPWQYSQEDVSLKRSFLKIVNQKLESNVNLDELYFDRTETIINWKPFLFNCIKIFLWGAFILYLLVPWLLGGYTLTVWWGLINSFLKSMWGSGIGGVIFTALVLPILVKTIVVNSRKAQVTTAEEFDTIFKKIVDGKEKIVIFVDDLDRCTSATVKTVLDSLRTFFYHPECSYVITGDHTVIERFAAEELNPKKDQLTGKDKEEGRRFLKKLFDVYWRLPLATLKVFDTFLTDEMKKTSISLSDTESKNIKVFLLDDRLFERNPRHAKRFITALKFALESVSLQSLELDKLPDVSESDEDLKEQKRSIKEILDNKDLLAKVLLIQEKFYPIYEKLVMSPGEIVIHERALRAEIGMETLTIDGRNILKDILEDDSETLKNYASLLMLEPQFTNIDNAVIFDPTTFFSSSVATGLPSLKGPDEANFPNYLISGQLADRLGQSLESAPKEKRIRFAKRALQVFDGAVDTDKVNVLIEGLKMSLRLDEWAEELEQWRNRLFQLPPDQQNAVASEWWKTVLVEAPNMIAQIRTNNPAYFDFIWISLQDIDPLIVNTQSIIELETIIRTEITSRPPVLTGLEIVLGKFKDSPLFKDLDAQLSDPAACKLFLDALQGLGLKDGLVATHVKEKLKMFLSDFSHIEWAIANKEFLKVLGLFDTVHTSIRKWVKDLKQLEQISNRKDELELSDDLRQAVGNELVLLATKSATLEFLNQGNIQYFLSKDNKKSIYFDTVKILGSNEESIDKRKQAGDLLIKNKTIWNDLEKDDIYEALKSIKKLKLSRIPDLKQRQVEILETWGFSES